MRIPQVIVCLLALSLTSCMYVPRNPEYEGPEPRPPELDEYYQVHEYWGVEEEVLDERKEYEVLEYILLTDVGPVTITFNRHYEHQDTLILVFPILGGKNLFANHFADYFAGSGYDTAIVHRDGAFKDPDNVERIEELFRDNVIRDRIALDFFEELHGKKRFGGFGISRGAINLAMTAGVDGRLKYNVLALGGENIVSIFRNSTQKGITKYRRKAQEKTQLDEDQLFDWLGKEVRTDPKYVAQHMDARDTLMVLALLDTTVPFSNGLQLRKRIGRPATIFLVADHYTALLFTQFIPIFPPDKMFGVFPFDYIERESVEFYDLRFDEGGINWPLLPFRAIQLPFRVLISAFDYIF